MGAKWLRFASRTVWITFAEAPQGFTPCERPACLANVVVSDSVPDYLNDLNAMHEAEKVLTMDQMRLYQDKLCWWINHYIYNDRARSGPAHHSDFVIHATAAQRAEAFLRTIGKWKGGAQ